MIYYQAIVWIYKFTTNVAKRNSYVGTFSQFVLWKLQLKLERCSYYFSLIIKEPDRDFDGVGISLKARLFSHYPFIQALTLNNVSSFTQKFPESKLKRSVFEILLRVMFYGFLLPLNIFSMMIVKWRQHCSCLYPEKIYQVRKL